MKIFVIVEGIPGRYVDTKRTEQEAKDLINSLKLDNRDMLDFELDYRILKKEI